jgi:hypothetical protein
MLLSDPKYGDNRTVREAKILLDDLATEDALALPTDEVIAKWKDIGREDDESWMDINFEDFERELKGEGKQKSSAPGVFGPEPPSGFGDSKTQADLRRMVERFESFLNDENAGIDGAEMADMDLDDDEEEEDDIDLDSEDEDKNVSFDEKEFARMMREMMGMPREEQDEVVDPSGIATLQPTKEPRVAAEVESSDEENMDEASEMKKVMERLEVELNEAGALNLDTTTSKLSAFKEKAKAERGEEDTKNHRTDNESNDEYDDEEIDIDFNLAKNLLESFKSQGKIISIPHPIFLLYKSSEHESFPGAFTVLENLPPQTLDGLSK